MTTAASTTRYIPNDEKPFSRTPSKQVTKALQDLIDRFPPGEDSCEGGFYSGTVSLAFLLMAIGQYYADIELESPYEDEPNTPLSAWLIAYLEVINKRFRRLEPPDDESCGISCSLLASLALTTAMTKNVETAKELCKEIGRALHKESSSNEWLYGRAGALYFLRLARASFARVADPETGELAPETTDERAARKALNRAIEKVIRGILDSPRPWKWQDKHYLGAVHGDAGIITQVILTEPGILTDPKFFEPSDAEPQIDYKTQLELDVSVLLSYQTEDGNWPSSASGGRANLVEFCHGAPGVVTSLQSIRDFFEYNPDLQARIDAAIEKGQDLIRRQGLVKKEPCLCHGISGNALTLERQQFEHFLTYTTPDEIKRMSKEYDIEMSSKRHASGLFTGAAGRIWAWAVADQEDLADKETDGHGARNELFMARRFLGYNDI